MRDTLGDLSDTKLVKTVIRANWENYHDCLERSPDHFMELVVCTELPSEGFEKLIENALAHFRFLNIRTLSWLTEECLPDFMNLPRRC